MKICPKCGVPKRENCFGKRTDGRIRSWCKKCKRSYDCHAYNTKPIQQQSVQDSNARRIERNRAYVAEYLKTHPCVDCGESDTRVLDFDHVRGQKLREISVMVNNAWALETLQKEIQKCDIRCANDHRRRTCERRIASFNSAFV